MSDVNVKALSARDAMILAASTMLLKGITHAGGDGAHALSMLERAHPRIRPLTETCMNLLQRATPISAADADPELGPEPDASEEEHNRIWNENLDRLGVLAEALMQQMKVATPAPDAPLPHVKEVAPDGTPIFESEPASPEPETAEKQTYTIAFTHQELHLVMWALTLAEAVGSNERAEAQEALEIYAMVRGSVDPDALAAKIDSAHQQARVDDGEVA